jgi:hypothetical protein
MTLSLLPVRPMCAVLYPERRPESERKEKESVPTSHRFVVCGEFQNCNAARWPERY